MKRKALLGTNQFNQDPPPGLDPSNSSLQTRPPGTEIMGGRTGAFTTISNGGVNLNSVVGDMEANKV